MRADVSGRYEAPRTVSGLRDLSTRTGEMQRLFPRVMKTDDFS